MEFGTTNHAAAVLLKEALDTLNEQHRTSFAAHNQHVSLEAPKDAPGCEQRQSFSLPSSFTKDSHQEEHPSGNYVYP